MNYYEHHLGDYDGATAHLSWLEDCAYRRLICLYYRNEGPIPADLKQACRLVRAASKAERDAVQQVLSEFFELQDDGWHHKRCDEEVARYREKSDKARASVSKRWANRNADAQRTQYESDTNVLPTNNEGNTPRARPQTPDTRHQSSEAKLPTVNAADAARSDTRALTAKDLIAEGVDPKAAADWLTVRKAKKAPLTSTAWEAVKREAAAAGLTPAQAVKHAAESNWQGFKASWLQRDASTSGPNHNGHTSRQLETAALMTGGARTAPTQETIDVESRLIPS